MSDPRAPHLHETYQPEVDVVETHFAELGMPDYQTTRQQIDFLIATTPGEFAVLLCDVDGLKEKNDEQGHQEGDQLIMDGGDVLFEAVKEAHGTISLGRGLSLSELDSREDPEDETSDQHNLATASHRKGDEFIVVLPGFEGQRQVEAFIERVQKRLEQRGVSMTISGRVHKMIALENEFTVPEPASELLRSADSLLQWDKGLRTTREMTPSQLEVAEKIAALATNAHIKLRDLPKIVNFLPFLDYDKPNLDPKRDSSSLEYGKTAPEDSSDLS